MTTPLSKLIRASEEGITASNKQFRSPGCPHTVLQLDGFVARMELSCRTKVGTLCFPSNRSCTNDLGLVSYPGIFEIVGILPSQDVQ